MDAKWAKDMEGKTTQEHWDALFDRQRKIKPDGKSVWLPKGDVYRHSGKLVEELPRLFKELDIKTFIDVGCSDYYFQQTVDWSGVDYLGLDIVQDMVDENKKNYPGVNFDCKNPIIDPLPKSDMIFIRNVLLHTSLKECQRIIENVKASGSRYLMASTVRDLEVNNETSHIWVVRRNLQLAPFNFPEPLEWIGEMKKDENPGWHGKNNYMGVWDIKTL